MLWDLATQTWANQNNFQLRFNTWTQWSIGYLIPCVLSISVEFGKKEQISNYHYTTSLVTEFWQRKFWGQFIVKWRPTWTNSLINVVHDINGCLLLSGYHVLLDHSSVNFSLRAHLYGYEYFEKSAFITLNSNSIWFGIVSYGSIKQLNKYVLMAYLTAKLLQVDKLVWILEFVAPVATGLRLDSFKFSLAKTGSPDQLS